MACLNPDNRQPHVSHSTVEAFGKRVGGIHNQTHPMLLAETTYVVGRHSPCEPHAVHQGHLLKVSLCGVVVGCRRLFADIHSQTAFRCSTEYQYH